MASWRLGGGSLLDRLVRLGDFRNRFDHVRAAPLRRRPEDIALLALYFAQGRPLSPRIVADLVRRPYPGNVRELRKAVEHAIEHPEELTEPREPTEQEIRTALATEDDNVSAAARRLGIERDDLRALMRKYGL